MKSVMISIRPKWCELIASGKRTIETRKTIPRIETPFKCYIYCTQSKEGLPDSAEMYIHGSGKVIGEFICDRVMIVRRFMDGGYNPEWSDDEDCITEQEFNDYSSNARTLYGLHISDLKIYDEPKELSEFRFTNSVKGRWDKNGCRDMVVRKPPQSWCYVEELT